MGTCGVAEGMKRKLDAVRVCDGGGPERGCAEWRRGEMEPTVRLELTTC